MINSNTSTWQKQAQKQIILDNPFHPLDLSAHDLLTVYKRFQASRQTNRNPKQQLPIQTIAQLISSLKGCKPSYVQKCMSQALIKDSISWNQFLAFLDQESEVRYKILDWLLHEKAIIKYRYEYEMPFRKKIVENFENITELNFITIGQDKLMLATLDHKKLALVDLTDKKFELIDEMILKNKKQEQQNPINNQSIVAKVNQNQRNFRVNKGKLESKQKGGLLLNRSIMARSQKLVSISDAGVGMVSSSVSKGGPIDEQAYLKKQRKNISTLFSLFSQLPNEYSARVAGLASERIQNRTLNAGYVSQIKQTFEGFATQKKHESRTLARRQQKPIQQAKKKLQSLYLQRTNLSYNPYKINRTYRPSTQSNDQILGTGSKKLNHDRKQKEYLMQSIHQKYCKQLNCIGMVYYNMQLSLVKVAREYNKIILEKQDTLKIISSNDSKKNQIIEMIDFYYHRTTDKWFVFVLFRNQEYKHEPKNNNDSFIKGYQIATEQIKFRGDKRYYFAKKKQEFYIDIGKNQIIKILAQPQYGIHLISHSGKYLTWKQDYVTSGGQITYWKKDFQEKFKGASLSLCCICVSSELNKAVLGTIKGTIVIFDLFSKQYKLRKISNHSIFQIEILEQKAYILTQNQKIILYDIVRSEQIQVLSVRNQQKLHEKIDKFTIENSKIVCFGSCIRVYEKFIDESLQQEKFKMENVYTWRLHKLDKCKGKENPNLKVIPTFRKQRTSAELLARSQNLFLILTQIQEAIFYSAQTLQVKFTTIIDIPHDLKIMRITISPDQKLVAVLLFTQAIHVFNIYTQEQVLFLKSSPYKKYSSISFLDRKNEYLLACGTESGKIVLVPFNSLPQKQPKLLELHTRNISLVTLKGDTLITSSQNQDLAIWQLPYNILRHELKLKGKLFPQDYVVEKLGAHQDINFFRTVSGTVIEINTAKGQIKSISNQFSNWSHLSIDVILGYLIGSPKPGEIDVYERKSEKQNWVFKKKFQIDAKSQVIGIGIVQSQKAAFFTKNGLYSWYYKNDKISKFKSYVQSIV